MKSTILVPYDFGQAADAALAWATDLQESTGSGPLQLVYAVSSLVNGVGDLPMEAMMVPTPEEIDELNSKLADAARRVGAVAEARTVIRASTIGDIILDEARASGANLIVMGTHGRNAFKRFFLGSVAQHVVRHANCPVVTIRGHQTEAARKADRPAA